MITANLAADQISQLAKETYGICKKEDIAKFSCHLLRVGACCILFAARYQSEFIQRILCWKSDAWRKYVRDLICTAYEQMVAISGVNDMPIF